MEYQGQVLLVHEWITGDNRNLDRSMSVLCTKTSGIQMAQIVIIVASFICLDKSIIRTETDF